MLCIGLMSGTSADGMDACIVDISDTDIRMLDALCIPYSKDFHIELRHLASAEFIAPHAVAMAEQTLADIAAEAIQQLLQRNSLSAADIAVIGNHGHTIRHQPQPNGFSWQIADHARLVELTQVSCVGDFRRRDIAAGGEGAPLVPAFHQFVLGQATDTAILNIGGIANITLFSPTLIGFDTGPGNALIDEWCQQAFGCDYDSHGQIARSGKIIPELLESWLSHPYFEQTPPKSTGRETFNLSQFGDITQYAKEDVLCTLTELTAQSIYQAIQSPNGSQTPNQPLSQLLVCGGGAQNTYMMERLSALMPATVVSTTELVGIQPDWMEAMAFAWLGWKRLQQQTANAPGVTGAKGYRILGALYQA